MDRPVARSGFGGVLDGRKWTFKRAFEKKVNFLACSLGDSGLFCVLFWEKVDFLECFLGEVDFFWQTMSKIVDHFGQFGTLGVGG